MPSVLEPTGLSRRDGKRPDGLTLVPWKRGRSMVWNVTCVHRLAASYTEVAAVSGAAVADQAERRKLSKYKEIETSHIVQPLVFETLGGFGISAWTFTRELGAMLRAQTMEPREAAFLRQRLSVAIQMGNAACLAESMGLT